MVGIAVALCLLGIYLLTGAAFVKALLIVWLILVAVAYLTSAFDA